MQEIYHPEATSKLSSLKELFKGPAIILGGGPSLQRDFAKVPRWSVKFAVNQYGFYLTSCHFVVFVDAPQASPDLLIVLNRNLAIRLSPWRDWSHIELPLNLPDCLTHRSAFLATYLASYLGGDPILLCGFDCYTDKEYLGQPFEGSLKKHLEAWRAIKKYLIGYSWAVSGPLTKIFGEYK